MARRLTLAVTDRCEAPIENPGPIGQCIRPAAGARLLERKPFATAPRCPEHRDPSPVNRPLPEVAHL